MVATIPDGEKLLARGLCLALGYALMNNIAAPSLSRRKKPLDFESASDTKEIYRAK